ncbi:MAG TPA: hypothetical protein PLB55_25485, partial [Prosthecobacter sp.]|nr:hypothetical protein [Prosthecobacter sp.]
SLSALCPTTGRAPVETVSLEWRRLAKHSEISFSLPRDLPLLVLFLQNSSANDDPWLDWGFHAG